LEDEEEVCVREQEREELHLRRRQGRSATAVVRGDLGACCAKKEERKGDKSCYSTSLGSNKARELAHCSCCSRIGDLGGVQRKEKARERN